MKALLYKRLDSSYNREDFFFLLLIFIGVIKFIVNSDRSHILKLYYLIAVYNTVIYIINNPRRICLLNSKLIDEKKECNLLFTKK